MNFLILFLWSSGVSLLFGEALVLLIVAVVPIWGVFWPLSPSSLIPLLP